MKSVAASIAWLRLLPITLTYVWHTVYFHPNGNSVVPLNMNIKTLLLFSTHGLAQISNTGNFVGKIELIQIVDKTTQRSVSLTNEMLQEIKLPGPILVCRDYAQRPPDSAKMLRLSFAPLPPSPIIALKVQR